MAKEISLGVKPGPFPSPVQMIATYNDDGSVDAIMVAWSNMTLSKTVELHVLDNHRTTNNIEKRKAFTLSPVSNDSATGEVYACRRVADSCVGNVLTDKLSDLWLKPMKQYREYDHFNKCTPVQTPCLVPYQQTCHRSQGRAGQPCKKCGTIIEKTVIGGRSSCYCPKCQAPKVE